MKNLIRSSSDQRGVIIIYELLIIFIFSTVMVATISYAVSQLKAISAAVRQEAAFQIAEAGVNYYQWRLAHYPEDFEDGTGGAGPYVHDYVDADTEETIGHYSLDITAPPVGSTIVTIRSTGYTTADPNIKKTVTVKYGIPSLAKYAFLTNSDVYIGSSSTISGELHSNGGIRFDGVGNAPITSAKSTYTCQPISGCSPAQTKPGIWGSAPAATQAFWDYPVPNVDFSTITSDFATIKADAQDSGIYLPPDSRRGYSLVFNANGTVSVYEVRTVKSESGYDFDGDYTNTSTSYNSRTLLFTQAIPANGLIFAEDDTWVEGTVNGRALVVAATLPHQQNSSPSIMIQNDITYAAKDGTDTLGLIGQDNVLISRSAPDDLEIDAAIVAQYGAYGQYYYPNNIKDTLTVYGAVSSFGVAGTYWTGGRGDSGYPTRNTTYDANLLYGPPPSFPISSSGYQQISWSSD